MIPNIILCITEDIIPIGKVVLILLPLGIYWIGMSLGRNVCKSYLWAFPALFLGAFNTVLSYLFGRGIIAVDMWLNLATTSGAEAGEMLSQIYPSVIFVSIVYLPTLTYAALRLKRERLMSDAFVKLQRRIGVAIFAVACVVTGFASRYERFVFLDDIFPFNVCYNFKLAVERQLASTRYPETSADFRFGAVSTDPDTLPEIVVLVIGETSRATNWQLCGYNRPTNPELSATESIIFYPDCLSQSNTTHKSVPILISPATAEDYSTLYTSKGLIAAYREAGFKTIFLSNEPRNKSFNDHLGEEAEICHFLRDELKGDPMDTLLLPIVEKHLAEQQQRLLLVLHTYGSHSTYSDRYVASQSYFHPDKVIKATNDNRHILINAYDNTIRLTDHLLASLIRTLEATGRPTALLYTSDHGEDIYDDERKVYLHASPTPSYYQLHVPLLAWVSASYEAIYPNRVEMMRARQHEALQTDCIYPTMLTLGGIRTPYGQTHLSIASTEYRTKPQRHYLDDHNNAVSLDRCFCDLDFAAMRRMKMRLH